jgi:monovalent cation:H+ antiporter-2, CPA2 family
MTGLGLTLLAALLAALILGTVAHRLRLPPMIGYIIAGLIVGPFTPGFVANREEVLALADIGVALLMFSIGLRFSLAELLSVGRAVLLAVPVQVAITMGLGVIAGLAIGWALIEALFIGAAAAICSTVVMVKLAGETSIHETAHGRIAIGASIVQDLLTIVLVVVLSALGSQSQEGLLDLVRATVVALVFVALAIVLGSRILPRLLALIADLGSRELFVIAVALIAIGMASIANSLGVSIALGAFVAGLALADSDLSTSVLGEIVPLRELFATFFFVSIGVLLDPVAVLEGLPVVVLLLAIITLGKALPLAGLAVLVGVRPGAAVRAGALLAQSGEFSFVLASAGLTLGAVRPEAFSLAMGAVVISILTAGPIVAGGDRLARLLDASVRLSRGLPGDPAPARGMRRHAVIVGYGRVGRSVARVLGSRGFAWVAIDGDYTVVREAREAGAPIIYGDGGTASVLDAARVADAHALVLTIPDALAARQAVEHARRRNERVEMVARAHSEAEELELRRLGVARIVVAERELGNELIRHALRRFGVGDREITAMLRQRRQG